MYSVTSSYNMLQEHHAYSHSSKSLRNIDYPGSPTYKQKLLVAQLAVLNLENNSQQRGDIQFGNYQQGHGTAVFSSHLPPGVILKYLRMNNAAASAV